MYCNGQAKPILSQIAPIKYFIKKILVVDRWRVIIAVNIPESYCVGLRNGVSVMCSGTPQAPDLILI